MTMCLESTRELHEVGTETEACTLAGRKADARAEEIQNGEDNRGNHRNDENFIEFGHLLGDDNHRNGNSETLKKILYGTRQNFRCRKTVHSILYSGA